MLDTLAIAPAAPAAAQKLVSTTVAPSTRPSPPPPYTAAATEPFPTQRSHFILHRQPPLPPSTASAARPPQRQLYSAASSLSPPSTPLKTYVAAAMAEMIDSIAWGQKLGNTTATGTKTACMHLSPLVTLAEGLHSSRYRRSDRRKNRRTAVKIPKRRHLVNRDRQQIFQSRPAWQQPLAWCPFAFGCSFLILHRPE